MRAHILDTYYGEGILDTQAADYPGFDGLYFKVCEGAYGYLDASGDIGEVTRQIAGTANEFKTVGIYHYPRRNDFVHWKKQADEYLRQCDLLDKQGVTVHYDVLDIERANIVNPDGKFPKAFGSWMNEIYKYVYARTQRPYFIYSDPYGYNEAFGFYGYKWVDELPWLVAQYPYRPWKEGLDSEAINEVRDPNITPLKNRSWVMWQYSDKYPAGDWMPGSKEADVNVWNGSLEDMLAYFGIEQEEVEEEQPTEGEVDSPDVIDLVGEQTKKGSPKPPASGTKPSDLAHINAAMEEIKAELSEIKEIVKGFEKKLGSAQVDVSDTSGGAGPAVVPTEPTRPGKLVKVASQNAEMPVYLSFPKGFNKQNKPIFEFYPSNASKVPERVYVKSGAKIRVLANGRTVGDGGNIGWKVDMDSKIPTLFGSAEVPEGVQLYVMEKDIKS